MSTSPLIKENFKILIVEDSQIDYIITEALLKKALPFRFQVQAAINYADGLKQLLESPPDIAFISYFILAEKGTELISEARAQNCQVPLILLTSKEDYEADLEAMSAGADDFLVKSQLTPVILERTLRYAKKVHLQHEEIRRLNQELEVRVNQRTSELIMTNYALQESERRMELLKDVASIANRAQSVEEAFRQTLATISYYTGWPVGHMALAQNHKHEHQISLVPSDLWYVADQQLYQGLVELTRSLNAFTPESLLGQARASWQPLCDSLQDYPNFAPAQQAQSLHLQSQLAIPIIVQQQVVAVMEFYTHESASDVRQLLKLIYEVAQQLNPLIERKQAEIQLRLAQWRLEQAHHIARIGSFVLSYAQGWIDCSPELVSLLQLEQERLSLEQFVCLIHPDDRPRTAEALKQSWERQLPLRLDKRFCLPDEQELSVHTQGEVETDAEGRSLQIVGVIQDISERKRFEDILVRMREAAESANQAKSLFLANMSHEIRTPMNAILGFTQVLLRDAAINPEQRQHLLTIFQSGEHLLELINDILELSKIESGRMSLNLSAFNLPQMLDGLKDMFAEKVQAKRLALNFSQAAEVPENLISDPAKLRQVLINLIGNAVKFTDQGQIDVRVWLQADNLLYWEVQDSGCGIAEQEKHKVFNSFEQTASGIRSQSGTGLGMTISRSYVELMGGSLDFRSQLGVGSCFYFTLPIEVSDQVEPGPSEQKRILGLRRPESAPRVLLVDDRPLNLKLLQEILHPLGFETRCASNGREAVEYFEQWRPEVVLMDTAMPEMDGVEATRRIRELERGKRAVILSISASAFDHDRAEILAAGATDFLAKPIREQDLLAILQKHLHLDYIYDENADPEPAVLSSLAGLSLADAPAELYTNMRQAFESGDLDALAELAAELPEPLAGFRAQIQDWAQQFAYDQLNQLFQGDRA